MSYPGIIRILIETSPCGICINGIVGVAGGMSGSGRSGQRKKSEL